MKTSYYVREEKGREEGKGREGRGEKGRNISRATPLAGEKK